MNHAGFGRDLLLGTRLGLSGRPALTGSHTCTNPPTAVAVQGVSGELAFHQIGGQHTICCVAGQLLTRNTIHVGFQCNSPAARACVGVARLAGMAGQTLSRPDIMITV